MPAVSRAQANLMAAAEHGATFPKAKQLRRRMSPAQLREFATTKRSGLPNRTAHVRSLANRLTAMRGAGAFQK